MSDNSGTFYALLTPSQFKLDGGAMFGIIPKPLWKKYIQPDEFNRIEMSLRVWLIRQDNKIILVDTGIGDYHPDKFKKRFGISTKISPLENELKARGIEAGDITDIIVGHLHFDHIGGLSRVENNKVLPVFKNATLHLHKKHYHYSKKPTPRDAGSFQSNFFEPVIDYYSQKDKINWLEKNSGVIINSESNPIFFRCSHGHTPYQVHPFDSKFIFMGDLVPTSSHVQIPWVMGYDMRPGTSSLEKIEFYQFIQEQGLIMIFDHDKEIWGSSLEKIDKEFKLDKTYSAQNNINSIDD